MKVLKVLTLLIVKIEAFGTLVSCSLVIFFSPSKRRNDSKVGGAFMATTKIHCLSKDVCDFLRFLIVFHGKIFFFPGELVI